MSLQSFLSENQDEENNLNNYTQHLLNYENIKNDKIHQDIKVKGFYSSMKNKADTEKKNTKQFRNIA
jgi:uncharacterized protein YutD